MKPHRIMVPQLSEPDKRLASLSGAWD